jgi:hypothetical protein
MFFKAVVNMGVHVAPSVWATASPIVALVKDESWWWLYLSSISFQY